jgi:hypothetical protein
VTGFFTSVPSVAAWRASTEWIASAEASTSGLWIFAAWPRYAEAPRFSTVYASCATCVALVIGNLPVGAFAGVPPSLLTAAFSAVTCESY